MSVIPGQSVGDGGQSELRDWSKLHGWRESHNYFPILFKVTCWLLVETLAIVMLTAARYLCLETGDSNETQFMRGCNENHSLLWSNIELYTELVFKVLEDLAACWHASKKGFSLCNYLNSKDQNLNYGWSYLNCASLCVLWLQVVWLKYWRVILKTS